MLGLRNIAKSSQPIRPISCFGRDDEQINDYLDCDVLIIDDLGTEPTIKNVTQEHIYNILNERLVNKRAFIITTNLDPNAIMERYDQRIARRILAKENECPVFYRCQNEKLRNLLCNNKLRKKRYHQMKKTGH
jgi:DNA replication protein DnaC